MKALTICQPFAHLVMIGDKIVENRTWPTRYRGPLAIHAGKSRQWLDLDEDGIDVESELRPSEMTFGAVIATCRLADCLHISVLEKATAADAERLDLYLHPHTSGPWCWILKNVMRLEKPIPAVGKQGLWEWEAA